MAVYWCAQCGIPYIETELKDGACPACPVPIATAPAAREAPPVPPAPSPGRAAPFLLGSLLGCLLGLAVGWAALSGNGPEPAEVVQDVPAERMHAEEEARKSEAARREFAARHAEALKLRDEALKLRDGALKLRDEANQEATAARKQKDDAERRLRVALASLGEEQARSAVLEKARTQPRRSPQPFIRDWQLLGPFTTAEGEAHKTVFAPEQEPIQLKKAYDLPGGAVRWRPYQSKADRIDLGGFFDYHDSAVAYAVSWVHSEAARDVTLHVGCDDGVVVWVNREKVADIDGVRLAAAGQNKVKARLREGWNQVLAKGDNAGGGWVLFLEFRTADDGKSLEVYSTNEPPPAALE